ncbi:MAG: methylmalonyl-CoA epimerase [Saprospiraceae bacterium]|nr:methylmalonyl-CoA epimerase [Saprospiraceae bacterium]
MKIDHLGIATFSISESEKMYQRLLGHTCYHYEEIPDQGVKVGFIQLGDQKLELLEPLEDSGPIYKFLEKRGQGVHHVAYKVDNIQEELDRLERDGFRLIDKTPRKGALGKWVAFVHPKSTDGVLTELCADPKMIEDGD